MKNISTQKALAANPDRSKQMPRKVCSTGQINIIGPLMAKPCRRPGRRRLAKETNSFVFMASLQWLGNLGMPYSIPYPSK